MMVTESDENIVSYGSVSRFIYLIALLFFALPFVSSALSIFRTFQIAPPRSAIEQMAGASSLALFILLILFVALRAYWVISGKTHLESPVSGAIPGMLRNTGIVFLYVGVAGYILIIALMTINAAPAIFAIFALPFKSMAPYGLLFFESGRMLAYENRKA